MEAVAHVASLSIRNQQCKVRQGQGAMAAAGSAPAAMQGGAGPGQLLGAAKPQRGSSSWQPPSVQAVAAVCQYAARNAGWGTDRAAAISVARWGAAVSATSSTRWGHRRGSSWRVSSGISSSTSQLAQWCGLTCSRLRSCLELRLQRCGPHQQSRRACSSGRHTGGSRSRDTLQPVAAAAAVVCI
jgi:hypothetical protein